MRYSLMRISNTLVVDSYNDKTNVVTGKYFDEHNRPKIISFQVKKTKNGKIQLRKSNKTRSEYDRNREFASFQRSLPFQEFAENFKSSSM